MNLLLSDLGTLESKGLECAGLGFVDRIAA